MQCYCLGFLLYVTMLKIVKKKNRGGFNKTVVRNRSQSLTPLGPRTGQNVKCLSKS